MSYEKVVAVYDNEASADAALTSLVSAGYDTDDISVIRNESDAIRAGLSEPGVWRRLFGRDLEHDEAAVLTRSFKEGSVIVSVRVSESEAPRAISLLDSHKPVDVMDRAKAYGLGATAGELKTPAPAKPRGEEMLRVAEEQLSVGKRMVESGHTRVRRYVVEKPVEANITLHEEHTEVIRRAITDPAYYVKDIDWSDQIIDVTETAEEAVVNKTARVTEEVVIRKQGSDHTQTVHDTVRRQQIDVEQVPVGAGTKKSA